MDSEAIVRLWSGPLKLELCPSVGGSICGFERAEDEDVRALLRKCNSPSKNVLDASCFPLVPYVNRIRGGCFTFRGREIRLQPNMIGDPNPLHGQGWQSGWRVESAADAEAELSFHHQAGEWPWEYEARQQFRLDSEGLGLRLSCRNLSDEPMPCGLGFHPYFPCGPTTILETRVTHAWTIDEHVLPVEKVPATGRFDLHDRRVCGQNLDHGFAGWSGSATMSDPEWPYELRLSSPTAKFFQLYSPATGGLFVAEPVTHANAALNAPQAEWPELGMHVLEPGEEFALDARIDVLPVDRRG